MKTEESKFLITYPSMMEIPNGDKTFIDLEEEKLSIASQSKYFFDKTLHIDLKNIESFTLRAECSMFYFLTKDMYIHLYHIGEKILEKNIFKIPKEQKIKDIMQWENVLFILTQNKVKIYSLITWQLLSSNSINILDPKAIAVDSKRDIYILDEKHQITKYSKHFTLLKSFVIENLEEVFSIFIKDDKLYIFEENSISKNLQMRIIDLRNIEDKPEVTRLETITQTYTKYKTIEKIILDRKNNFWILGKEDKFAFINQKRVYQTATKASYIFDSTIEKCEWYKLESSFHIPSNGGIIRFEIGASNNKLNIKSNYLLENSSHIYLEDIVGRYLKITVTLLSDPQQTTTPIFHYIKAFFPKKTYTEYLPPIYQEDIQSKLLLDRFLSIFETINQKIEKNIDTSHLLVDPLTSKSEFLEWLSKWVGLNRKKYWDDKKWRELLSKSTYFFKKRGTREGLISIIQLYTNIRPTIIEPFQLKCKNGDKLFDIGEYNFCILFKPNELKNREELRIVQEIVNLWKPAHTIGKVSILSNRMVLGGKSPNNLIFLGQNSYLSKEDQFILGEAILPLNTRVSDIEDNLQIESRSRIGIDTKIKY